MKAAKMIVPIFVSSIQLYDKTTEKRVNQYTLQINDP